MPPHSLEKAVGGENIMWSFEQNESDIKLKLVLYRSAFNSKDFFKQ